MKRIIAAVAVLVFVQACMPPGNKEEEMVETNVTESTLSGTIDSLVIIHGEEQRGRIARGVRQTGALWRESDGGADAFMEFCLQQYVGDEAERMQLLARFEHNMMLIRGHLYELRRSVNEPLQLERGSVLPVDGLFGEFSPSVHLNEDFFKTRIAFVALLNFRQSTLEERIADGAKWNRTQWAEARLLDSFDARVPSHAAQTATAAYTRADTYINNYNVYMHNVLDAEGQRLFPEGLKLISHWGLRDELKAQYGLENGYERQTIILNIMNRIIEQSIPAAVIDNPDIDWNVVDNSIVARDGATPGMTEEAEGDRRYAMWLEVFRAEKGLDPYSPQSRDYIERKFNESRQIPEAEVEALLTSICNAPILADIAELIRERLGRDLEPFDIWYTGLKSRPRINEEALDAVVRAKYPTAAAFEEDIPNVLVKLGFSFDRAQFIADHISVDPSRGAGHASPPGRLGDRAHLRTRIGPDGMNYKGYNIAIHELGHNVEQVLSFELVDNTLLRGVPNTAFTEAFAFLFQSRDLDLLDRHSDQEHAEAWNTLDLLWSTYEISGVALVDMRVWRWMYEHPDADAEEMREAVMDIARGVWNEYFAPVFGIKDVSLLCIYSHMVDAGMYTPDYPLGHIISFQIEEYMKGKVLAEEMERMCVMGNVTPDLWMRNAVGAPISTEPLILAAESALETLRLQAE